MKAYVVCRLPVYDFFGMGGARGRGRGQLTPCSGLYPPQLPFQEKF